MIEEPADQAEDGHPREVAEDAEGRVGVLDAVVHRVGVGVLHERPGDALVSLLEPDADDHESGDAYEPGAAGPVEHAAGGLVGVRASASGAGEDLDRGGEEDHVGDAAGDAVDAVLEVVLAVGAAERRPQEPPGGVAEQAEGDDRQQHRAERLVGDRPQRALLVGGLAAVAERELGRQHADHDVDHAARRDPESREPAEAARAAEAMAVRAGPVDGERGVHPRAGTRSVGASLRPEEFQIGGHGRGPQGNGPLPAGPNTGREAEGEQPVGPGVLLLALARGSDPRLVERLQ